MHCQYSNETANHWKLCTHDSHSDNRHGFSTVSPCLRTQISARWRSWNVPHIGPLTRAAHPPLTGLQQTSPTWLAALGGSLGVSSEGCQGVCPKPEVPVVPKPEDRPKIFQKAENRPKPLDLLIFRDLEAGHKLFKGNFRGDIVFLFKVPPKLTAHRYHVLQQADSWRTQTTSSSVNGELTSFEEGSISCPYRMEPWWSATILVTTTEIPKNLQQCEYKIHALVIYGDLQIRLLKVTFIMKDPVGAQRAAQKNLLGEGVHPPPRKCGWGLIYHPIARIFEGPKSHKCPIGFVILTQILKFIGGQGYSPYFDDAELDGGQKKRD